jgi:hypothetical protein
MNSPSTPEMGSVHEPEAELVGYKETLEDYAHLKSLFDIEDAQEPSLSLRVPLSAMLDAIDHMQVDALRQVARRAQSRLAALHTLAEPKDDYITPEKDRPE